MPFALITIGLLLVIVGVQGTQQQFGQQLYKDFSGPGNFVYWIIALGVVGSLGYIPSLKSFSRWFMALIIVAMFLANDKSGNVGFFQRILNLEKGNAA